MGGKRKVPIIELTMLILALLAILTVRCMKWFPYVDEYDTYTVSCTEWPEEDI